MFEQEKQLIIIAGSCSGKSNWFDQINYYKNQGYQVEFLEVDAGAANSLLEASSKLFSKLKHRVKQKTIILSHSMGSMLLLKILSEPKFYASENPELYRNIVNSKLIFLQVPLHVNAVALGILDILKYFFYPFLFVYNLLVFPVIDFILLMLKTLMVILEKLIAVGFIKYPAMLIFKPIALSLNMLLVINTFWGTKPREFFNVIKFYKQWQDFALDGFFAKEQDGTAFDKAMIGATENTMDKFDRSNVSNYYFTHCFTDFFCDPGLTKEFANRLGANSKSLNYGFHSPQHCFWHQGAINRLIETSL
ncbi:MAG: hypothetical protein O3C63_01570 [Cyanobacteria bacterium]|nr:hypothetical protein [Cyanobacteriota bacterium]MDA1019999.1 hypothetical protein [Cyanobacteriota bacterium]